MFVDFKLRLLEPYEKFQQFFQFPISDFHSFRRGFIRYVLLMSMGYDLLMNCSS